MKMPIPDDYEIGNELTCFSILWPDTPKWIGVLQGMITSIQQGRLWDEKTGSIHGIKAIGRVLEAANLPLVVCSDENGEPDENGNSTTCNRCGSVVILEDWELPVTRIVPIDASGYEIPYDDQSGRAVAGLRWYMGECCPHDIYFAGEFTPPDDSPIDPPPGDIEGATACTKARKIVATITAILNAGFGQIGVEDTPLGFMDFAGGIQSLFPEIAFGKTELYNLFYACYALKIAGLESETEATQIGDYLACALVDVFEDGKQGITQDQYESAKSITSNVLSKRVGDSAYEGFGKTIRQAWEFTIRSIGPGDATKLTTNLTPTADESCDCPEDIEGNPPQSDWVYRYDLVANQNNFLHNGIDGAYELGVGYKASTIGDAVLDLTLDCDTVTGGQFTRLEVYIEGAPGTVVTAYTTYSSKLTVDTTGYNLLAASGAGTGRYYANLNLPVSMTGTNASLRVFKLKLQNQSTKGFVVKQVLIAGNGSPCVPAPLASYLIEDELT